MIRAALQTNKGPIGIVGINHENLRRMQAGMMLDIDIGMLTPPGGERMNRIIVHYAYTYEQVVDDMEAGGLPVSAELRKQARALDEQLEREKHK